MNQLFWPPNLVSLSRIVLLWPAAHFIAGETTSDTIWCLVVVFVAGLTDGLDGFLARRMNLIGRLGIALDPIADKIFVGGLALLAIVYRDFPVWLAAVIVGRDLAIMIVGGLLMRGREISLPSNITGKYTFGSLVGLLFSHIIRFDYGIIAYMTSSVILLVASTILYARIMIKVKKGIPLTVPDDPRWLKLFRIIGSWLFVAVYVFVWLHQNTDLFSS